MQKPKLRSNLAPIPFAQMKIWDSVLVPVEPDWKTPEVATIKQRVIRFQKKNPPIRFTIRKEEKGMRVTRIEDFSDEVHEPYAIERADSKGS